MLRLSFSLFLSFSGLRIIAQEVTHQQSYWVRVYFQGNIAPKWTWNIESDERRLIRPNAQLQFIAHLRVQRTLNKALAISGGSTWSVVNDIPEWRLFQEFHWTIPLTEKLKAYSRFRTEQRFFHVAEDDWQQHFRWRYRLQAAYSIWPYFIIKCSDEYMWQNDAFDQNRIYSAIEYRFSKWLSFEIGYLKLFQRRQENRFFCRDILRTTFYLTAQ